MGTGRLGPLTNYGVGSQPNGITAGDFDGDGWLDLAVANYNSHNVSVLRGRGTGRLVWWGRMAARIRIK